MAAIVEKKNIFFHPPAVMPEVTKRQTTFGSNPERQNSGTTLNLSNNCKPDTKSTQDNNKINKAPANAQFLKKQIAFQGFFAKEFLKGSELVAGSELAATIRYFLSPENSTLIKATLKNAERTGLISDDKKLRIVMPLAHNLKEGFISFPRAFYRGIRSIFDSGFREQRQIQKFKNNARNTFLGLWVHINRFKSHFENATTGKNLEELKTIVKDGIEGKEKQLAAFFKKRKLDRLYSFSDDKPNGYLGKVPERMQNFVDAVLKDNPKALEETKKGFVDFAIYKETIKKTGSFLPNYSGNIAQTVAKLVSGMITTWFIANDFYNLKILTTNDKKEAKKEWRSKFAQESSNVGLIAYQGFVATTALESYVNKSLPFAMGLNVLTYISSNIISRLFTNRPILPVGMEKSVGFMIPKEKKAEKNANAQGLTIKDLNIPPASQKVAFKGANQKAAKGLFNTIRTAIANFDNGIAKHMPAQMKIDEFKNIYERLKKIEESDARKLLKIANKYMELGLKCDDLTIQTVETAALANGNNVKIGENALYRYGKTFINVIKLPLDIVVGISKWGINKVRTALGKEAFKGKQPEGFSSIQFIKNVKKWVNKAEQGAKTATGEIDSEDVKIIYGTQKQFFSTKILEYGAEQLSNGMKLTGFTAVPFLAVDAYNSTMAQTKNKDYANDKMNERALQDSLRQGVSFWSTYGVNALGKSVSNASLLGNAAVVATNITLGEILTRKLVGQPLTPATREEMLQAEQKRNKSNNWFVKIMASKLRANDSFAASSLNSPASAKSVTNIINAPNSVSTPNIYQSIAAANAENQNSSAKSVSNLSKEFFSNAA